MPAAPTTLATSPADVVRQMLIDAGVASDGGTWPAFVESEPFGPDDCVTITDTVGRDQARDHISGRLYGTFGVQVRVRSSRFGTGWVKADAIRDKLARAVNATQVVVDGTPYLVACAVRIGNVLPLGKDVPNSKRSLFTVNAEVHVQQMV